MEWDLFFRNQWRMQRIHVGFTFQIGKKKKLFHNLYSQLLIFAAAVDERVADTFAPDDTITAVFAFFDPGGDVRAVLRASPLQHVVLNIPV